MSSGVGRQGLISRKFYHASISCDGKRRHPSREMTKAAEMKAADPTQAIMAVELAIISRMSALGQESKLH